MKTTFEKFEELINKRGGHKDLGVPEGTFRAWRKQYNDGILSKWKQMEILEKAGCNIIQPILWE